MSDTAELTHCYFEAQKALLEGRDPDLAAACWLRPDGVLTWSDRRIANRAVLAARKDLHQSRANIVLAALNRVEDARSLINFSIAAE